LSDYKSIRLYPQTPFPVTKQKFGVSDTLQFIEAPAPTVAFSSLTNGSEAQHRDALPSTKKLIIDFARV